VWRKYRSVLFQACLQLRNLKHPYFAVVLHQTCPFFTQGQRYKTEGGWRVLIDSMEQSIYGGTNDVCVICPGYYEPFMEFHGLLPSSRYPPVDLSQTYCIGAAPSYSSLSLYFFLSIRTSPDLLTSILRVKWIYPRIFVTVRRGRRRRQLLGDLKEKRGNRKLKEEALDRTLWRTGFGNGYGPVV